MMEIGDVCELQEAPVNAVLRAVKQESFAMAYLFTVVRGEQIRVAHYDEDTWVGCKDISFLQYAPKERVRVVAFFKGELSLVEAESY